MDKETKLVITSEDREAEKGKVGIRSQEVQTIMYKTNYKDIWYNTEKYS